jgi:hypothetical protein
MSVKSTFHFNERKYRDKISKDDTKTLIRKHHIKTMRFSACGVGLVAGTVATISTGGIAAVGPIYARRQAIINYKQQKITEKNWPGAGRINRILESATLRWVRQ